MRSTSVEGSPVMRVLRILPGGRALCAWFDARGLGFARALVPVETLTVVR